MFSPQHERHKKLIEMAPVVRVFAILLTTFALLHHFPPSEVFPLVIVQFVFILIVLYLITLGYESFRQKLAQNSQGKPIFLDYVTLSGSFIFLSIVLFYTGLNESSFKILMLPPILFYTIRFGLLWGLVSSGVAALTLCGVNMYALLGGETVRWEIDFTYVGVFFLISWLVGSMVDMERAISDRLSREVAIDNLTGLYNHRHLHEELQRRVNEEPNGIFGFILADLDFFKHYNETQSHLAGDDLLIAVAETISSVAAHRGIVFRYGSDEFAVIIDGADRAATIEMAEEIRCSIRDQFKNSSDDPFWKFNLTASLGLAVFPEDAATKDELLKKADEALYKAKVISGNKVEAYFSIMEQIKDQVASDEEELFNKLKTLLVIINARDRYTYGHSERVLIYAGVIASLINMTEEEKRIVEYGAYLHDIGKIDIDRVVLNKPEKLNADEWQSIKNHPVWGAEIVKQVKALDPVIPTILYHHERFDGQGYPFGLAGQSIPISARIIALADSFDAITVDRPYSRARSLSEAVVELEEHKGTQFDPFLVDKFVKFIIGHDSVNDILAMNSKQRF